MHDLTLLIQLFGRDTMDRLSGLGFDSTSAIARAGVDRLAAEGGIDAPLARRIVSVALEALAADELLAAGAEEEIAVPSHPPAPKRAGRAERKARPAPSARPARRPLKPALGSLASAPPAGIDSGPGPEEGRDRDEGRAGVESGGEPSETPAEALIDDAGLVTWMGFSTGPGAGRAMSFSVADAILDGGAPKVAEAPPGEDGAPAGASRTIEGSFWSFGLKPRSGPGAPVPGRQEGPAEKRMRRRASDVGAGPAGWPGGSRRRSRDDQ